ncbi:hypothetical protein HXX76_004091 [Chlamydomonas incerta]|uniref:Diphthine--ammonia ligase n=1 Tax=Chlamydomonas incerta TaxID=51695 RepID=A0A835T6S8_CHLIN|nr:hypothetical protein HXX76_004091 [Chlamydomonas incerta]|eukprot:KAG2439972.1 hypothetical protein HXX76_004091 [Chlamydomonas incerta]
MTSDNSADAKPRKTAVSFTGGKDSMTVVNLLRDAYIALEASSSWPEDAREAWTADLRSRLDSVAGCELALLVTFVPVGAAPFKAHPLEIVKLQAAALGLPHLVMEVSAAPTFLDSYRDNISRLRSEHGVEVLATGDMLDVCSSFMPRAAAGTGVQLLSPLWDIGRRLLLELVWAYGMEPVITCVNVTKFRVQQKEGAEEQGQGQAQGQPEGTDACGAAAGSAGASSAGQAAAAGAPGDDKSGTPEAQAGAGAGAGAASEDDYSGRLLGQRLTRQLHAAELLPAVERFGVDEAGEWGEYHTMVLASRLFAAPLALGAHSPQREGDYAYLAHTAPPQLQQQ